MNLIEIQWPEFHWWLLHNVASPCLCDVTQRRVIYDAMVELRVKLTGCSQTENSVENVKYFGSKKSSLQLLGLGRTSSLILDKYSSLWQWQTR
jgi:hypothetical protein